VIADVAVSVVSKDRSGMAAGINDTFRQVSIAVGVAAWGAIFLARGAAKISALAPGAPAHRLIEAASSGLLPHAAHDAAATAARQGLPGRAEHDPHDRRAGGVRRRSAGRLAGPRARDRARAARARRFGGGRPRW
jgi:hypothetical protein